MVDSTAVERATSNVACKLVGQEFMQRKSDISNALFRHAVDVTDLPDGFIFRFAGFDLIVEPDQGPVQLMLRGSGEVKAFVLGELGIATSHVAATT